MTLSLRNMHKSFGRKKVLEGLTLEVSAGSIVGLLGTNGSGKSTLIKCAVGLLRPQSGDCELLGEPSWTLSAAAKLRLGYVPQVISIYPWMTVDNYIAYTAAFYTTWNSDFADRLQADFALEGGDPRRQPVGGSAAEAGDPDRCGARAGAAGPRRTGR